MEKKGLRINRSKTEYKEYEFDEREQVDKTRGRMVVDEDEL